jgi:1,2-dihydroxy-3-keto-5-methylthiopentene dioxygenase
MSELNVYADDNPSEARTFTDGGAIAHELSAIGVLFERWEASAPLSKGASQDEVLAAYRQPVDRLMSKYSFQTADVVGLTPDHPNKAALRGKFLNEHTHSEDEVRFFVGGKGLFYLHAGGRVFAVLCEQGDLISVPAGMTHWFDMGSEPDFQCIRLFSSPVGWVASFTGSDIASRFPPLGEPAS